MDQTNRTANPEPKSNNSVIIEDPRNVFRFENEWNVGFCDCGEDTKLCKSYKKHP